MTILARRIVASPTRSASDVWMLIVELLAPDRESSARQELLEIAGVATSLIADEALKDAAAVAFGAGPRVRIYCLHGEAAITGENISEAPLPFLATDGDWKLSLPCPKPDLTWVKEALKKKTSRVTARDSADKVEDAFTEVQVSTSVSPIVDREAFFRK